MRNFQAKWFLPFFIAWNFEDLVEQLFVFGKDPAQLPEENSGIACRWSGWFLWRRGAFSSGRGCGEEASLSMARPIPTACCFGFQIVWIFLYQQLRTPGILTLIREKLWPQRTTQMPAERRFLEEHAMCAFLSSLQFQPPTERRHTAEGINKILRQK